MLQSLRVIYNDLANFPLLPTESRSYDISGWAKWIATATLLTLHRCENRAMNIVNAKIIGVNRSLYNLETLPELVNLLVNRFAGKNILQWRTCVLHPNQPVFAVTENGDACEKCIHQMVEYDEVCAICLDETRQHAIWVENTGCQHCFHASCLLAVEPHSVNGNSVIRCPLCRTPYHSVTM